MTSNIHNTSFREARRVLGACARGRRQRHAEETLGEVGLLIAEGRLWLDTGVWWFRSGSTVTRVGSIAAFMRGRLRWAALAEHRAEERRARPSVVLEVAGDATPEQRLVEEEERHLFHDRFVPLVRDTPCPPGFAVRVGAELFQRTFTRLMQQVSSTSVAERQQVRRVRTKLELFALFLGLPGFLEDHVLTPMRDAFRERIARDLGSPAARQVRRTSNSTSRARRCRPLPR